MLSTSHSKECADAKKGKKQIQKDQLQSFDPAEEEKSRSESFHSQTRDNKNEANNNTLGSLTKKFVQLIKGAPNQIIEIEQASQKLDIQKRRIYDITNVLEGIGYIQKLGKNQMKWVGGQQGAELQLQVKKLQQQSEQLEQEMFKVQEQISELKNQLINLSNSNTYLNYFIKEDIIMIMKALKVKSILLFIGGNGDQLEILSNPDKKTSQWTIQSGSTLSKLFHCRLNEDNCIEITQNPTFDRKNQAKDKKVKTIKEAPQQKKEVLFKNSNYQATKQAQLFFEHQFLDYGLMLSSGSLQKEKYSEKSEEILLNLQKQ